jgi:hypothetical protein
MEAPLSAQSNFAEAPFHFPELPLQGLPGLVFVLLLLPTVALADAAAVADQRADHLSPGEREEEPAPQERPHEGRRVGGSRDVAKQDLLQGLAPSAHRRMRAKEQHGQHNGPGPGSGPGLGDIGFRHAVVLLSPGPPPPVRWLAVAQ